MYYILHLLNFRILAVSEKWRHILFLVRIGAIRIKFILVVVNARLSDSNHSIIWKLKVWIIENNCEAFIVKNRKNWIWFLKNSCLIGLECKCCYPSYWWIRTSRNIKFRTGNIIIISLLFSLFDLDSSLGWSSLCGSFETLFFIVKFNI